MPASDKPGEPSVSVRRRIAFFDRDGTLIENKPYQSDPSGIAWMPGAPAAIRFLNDSGWCVGIVTNQSAVARGYCTESQVDQFHYSMRQELAAVGARLDFIYYCPFHDQGSIERYRVADHSDRKPNPGMIKRALRSFEADRDNSFLVGDQETDMVAAGRAGIRGYLYDGQGSLLNLVKLIIERRGRHAHLPALSWSKA